MKLQKHYKDFTVGELLDMGLSVEVSSHDESESDARVIARKFEGAKQSTQQITNQLKIVRAWKGSFKATFYI